MTTTNVKPGTYDFQGSNGVKIGTVHVNNNGDWSYIGHQQGSNSGRVTDAGGGNSNFVDHKNNVVGSWSKGDNVSWSDKDGSHTGTLKKR